MYEIWLKNGDQCFNRRNMYVYAKGNNYVVICDKS